jgi:hypothetical protein
MNLQITLMWLVSWVALLVLSVFAAESVHFATPELDPSAMPITLASCLSWLAVLLIPVNSDHNIHLRVVVLWAVMAAAGFLTLSSSPLYFEQGNRNLQLAGGVLTLILLFSAMRSLMRVYTLSHASSMILLTLIASAFFAAPLYLSVIAEATSHQTLIVDTIIAASPVSYLAGIADYDYLRSTWFYQNMPFGGLRFNYPAPGIMTVCYISITLVLAGASILGNRLKLRALKQ